MGRHTKYGTKTKTVRIPVPLAPYAKNRTIFLPEKIEFLLKELEPRKDKVRAKLAYDILLELQALANTEDDTSW